MKSKTKKLRLAKVTISKLNKNTMNLIIGGTQVISCGQKTDDIFGDPDCRGSEVDC